MSNKKELQELLDKLDFLMKLDEDSIDISEIEKILGTLVSFSLFYGQTSKSDKYIWRYHIYFTTSKSGNCNRLHALRNELKHYLTKE